MQLFQDRRFILGGASTDMPYMYGAPDALPPFDRSGTNGFRLISYSTPSLPPRILRGHFHFKNLTTETSSRFPIPFSKCMSVCMPMTARRQDRERRRQLALLAPATHHLQRCLWQRACYRLPFPAEKRIRTLSDRGLLSAQRLAIVPRPRTIAVCVD